MSEKRSHKKMDPDVKGLKVLDRAIRSFGSRRMVKASLEWAWQKYVMHGDKHLASMPMEPK